MWTFLNLIIMTAKMEISLKNKKNNCFSPSKAFNMPDFLGLYVSWQVEFDQTYFTFMQGKDLCQNS